MKLRLALCSSLAVLIFSGCFDSDKKAEQKQGMPPMPVDFMELKSGDVKVSLRFPAVLESKNDVFVSPKVNGEITKKYFKNGDLVKKGDKLYEIDKAKYQASYMIAKSSVDVAEANQKSAKREFSRNQNLYNKKALSQKEYDLSLSNYEIANAELTKARASFHSASLDLNYADVKAPFSGRLAEGLVDVGNFVSAGNTKLVRLVDNSKIQAKFYIPDTINISKSDDIKARIFVDNKEFLGNIDFIESNVDKASVKAIASFENQDDMLKPGSFVMIEIYNINKKDSFALPQKAVLQDIDGAFVYIMKDGKAHKVKINPSFEDITNVIVSKSQTELKDNDKLILNNFKKISEGSAVLTNEQFGAMMKQMQQAQEPKK